jgi:hypothetical protein
MKTCRFLEINLEFRLLLKNIYCNWGRHFVDVTTAKVNYILVTWCATMKYMPRVLSPVTDIYHTGAALT